MSILLDDPAPAVRRIRIDRPAARNAIDDEVRAALLAAIDEAGTEPAVRAVVIGGVGGLFCAGGDLPSLVGLDHDAALARMRSGHAVVSAVWSCPKPVVVAVERFAIGAGAGLALLADEIVMGRSAIFAFPFLRLGLVPDWGLMGSLRLRAGWAAAQRIVRDGQPVKADEAVPLGLADRLADDAAVMDEAIAAAIRLADHPPAAFARFKQAMRGDAATALALHAEAEAQADCIVGAEFAEGYAAFRDKRDPVFGTRP